MVKTTEYNPLLVASLCCDLCRELLDVWTELQDVHDAHGLRYQWGGSHSNKKLLCSLGIDTRNIVSLLVS